MPFALARIPWLCLLAVVTAWQGPARPAVAQEADFTPILNDLEFQGYAAGFGTATWANLDGDGLLDLVVAGNRQAGPPYSSADSLYAGLFYNLAEGEYCYPNGGACFPYQLFEANPLEQPVWHSAAAWGDYDGDGDLDLALAGATRVSAPYEPVTRLYRNDGAKQFTPIEAGLEGVTAGMLAWGDYDNDGDLDLLVAGLTAAGYRTSLYRNDAGTFTDAGAGLLNLAYGDAAWGDYDNDGDLDLVLVGEQQGAGQAGPVVQLYRNDAGTLTALATDLEGLLFGTVAWGDYDGDGDLDLLTAGGRYGPLLMEGYTRLYRNENGAFTEVETALPGLMDGRAAWGDYDNDGDLDVLVVGAEQPLGLRLGYVYENRGGAFVEAASLSGVLSGEASWGDYDYDGDLDVLYMGLGPGSVPMARLFRNDRPEQNAPPSAPEGLQAVAEEGSVTLSWNSASDAHTPAAGLTYNLRVSTSPGGAEVMPPHSGAASGQRWVPQPGNTGPRTTWRLTGLAPGAYYWSVQALDGSFNASAFAPEQRFTFGNPDDTEPPAAPAGLTAAPGVREVVLSWRANTEPDLARYRLYRGTSPEALAFAASFQTGTTTYVDADVTPGTAYYYRLTAEDVTGNESEPSDAASAVPFDQAFAVQASLPGVFNGEAVWGDYDNDGDLDVLAAGQGVANIFRNDAGAFQLAATLAGVSGAAAAWGDYDNDGDLDVLLSGSLSIQSRRITEVFRNDGGAFIALQAGLPGLVNGSVAWGDYDNDGDLDILLSGEAGAALVTEVHRNDAGRFSDAGASLAGISYGDAVWGDYDSDGDLDLVIAGNGITQLYWNDEGSFRNSGIRLRGVANGSAAGGDYDNDGDLDLLLTGGNVAQLYVNEGGTFTGVQTSLLPVTTSDAAWGDFDGDGDLDIALTGSTGGDPNAPRVAAVYRNDGGTFAEVESGLNGVSWSSVAWGDYDGDGDLDLLLTGEERNGILATKVYRNEVGRPNAPPEAPTGLAVQIFGSVVVFVWQPAGDAETPAPGLTYTLRLGTTPGGMEVASPMADVQTGARRVAAFGSVMQPRAFVRSLPAGTYYWSVQAVDAGLAGSPFAAEGQFTTGGTGSSGTATDVETGELPEQLTLSPSGHPNPFRDRTAIRYGLPAPGHVRLVVYNVLGEAVRTLVAREEAAGLHEAVWDGTDAAGAPVSAGLYLYRLETDGGERRSGRMLLLH